ncbi:MAG: MotA/TolQ/ExbB proton channel family protein [Elusimicrobia bacterium]|nr:MotA/TolQ/ExbB proton channel family protein [Elusimicrobiota bacterium]
MAAPGAGFNVGIKDIIVSGGPTLALLIFLSIYSVALIWERWKTFRKSSGELSRLSDKLRAMLQSGSLAEAVALCRAHKGAASSVVMASLTGSPDKAERKRSAERAIERAAADLQKSLTTLGTIASVAPFIGLFGTVIGVMRAFRDLASAAGAGPGVVAIGISEALVCTAAGIFVAIPALAAYNYFNLQASRFSDEMGWLSEEIIEKLSEKAHR